MVSFCEAVMLKPETAERDGGGLIPSVDDDGGDRSRFTAWSRSSSITLKSSDNIIGSEDNGG